MALPSGNRAAQPLPPAPWQAPRRPRALGLLRSGNLQLLDGPEGGARWAPGAAVGARPPSCGHLPAFPRTPACRPRCPPSPLDAGFGRARSFGPEVPGLPSCQRKPREVESRVLCPALASDS